MTAGEIGPVRVTRSRRPRRAVLLVAMGIIVALGLLPYGVGGDVTSTLVDFFTLLTMASMWNLLAGYAGLVSVGEQAFVGIGAYVILVAAQWGLQPYLAVPLAAVLSGALAVPISWLVLRLRGGYFAIATWVVADAVLLAMNRFPSLGGGTGAVLPGMADINPVTRLALTYWVALAVAIVALVSVYLLLRSRLGLVLTAVRDNEIGARSAGAYVGSAKRIVFVAAAAGCGLAGSLLILSQLNVLATNVFSVSWSAKMIFITIIGGIGSIEGPIIGTIVFFLLQEGLASFGAWYFIVLGGVAMIVALVAPRGLWGMFAQRFSFRPFPLGYWLWLDTPETHDSETGAATPQPPGARAGAS